MTNDNYVINSHGAWGNPSEAVRWYEAELNRLHAANIDCLEHFNALKAERDALLAIAKELQESAAYWSEYDVPLGIVDRLNAAIAKAEA